MIVILHFGQEELDPLDIRRRGIFVSIHTDAFSAAVLLLGGLESPESGDPPSSRRICLRKNNGSTATQRMADDRGDVGKIEATFDKVVQASDVAGVAFGDSKISYLRFVPEQVVDIIAKIQNMRSRESQDELVATLKQLGCGTHADVDFEQHEARRGTCAKINGVPGELIN